MRGQKFTRLVSCLVFLKNWDSIDKIRCIFLLKKIIMPKIKKSNQNVKIRKKRVKMKRGHQVRSIESNADCMRELEISRSFQDRSGCSRRVYDLVYECLEKQSNREVCKKLKSNAASQLKQAQAKTRTKRFNRLIKCIGCSKLNKGEIKRIFYSKFKVFTHFINFLGLR